MSTAINSTVAVVSISLTGSHTLPSQAGKAGRPRSRGRAWLRSEDSLNIGACQRALAEEFGCKPKDVQHYPRETADGVMAFIVPGIDKDTCLTFSASMVLPTAEVEAASVPVSEVSSEAAMLDSDGAKDSAPMDDDAILAAALGE